MWSGAHLGEDGPVLGVHGQLEPLQTDTRKRFNKSSKCTFSQWPFLRNGGGGQHVPSLEEIAGVSVQEAK